MSVSPRLRWLAPVLAAGVVAAGVGLSGVDPSDAAEALPDRTAADLLEAVSTARVDGISGTVVSTSRLGLPELPSSPGGGGSALQLQSLAAGSTTARLWAAGDDRSRLAVDAPFAEYDVVRNGADVWTYDSASSDVTHVVLPEGGREEQAPPQGVPTPQEAAETVLSLVEPTTAVTVGRTAMVADRPSYELVLDPRDPGTLVDTVRLAVDSETSVPLRVQVFGVGQAEPAIEVGFTSVRFGVPDASVFRFVPPAGADVTEKTLPLPERRQPEARPAPAGGAPQVLGEGWTSVVALSGVTLPEEAAGMLSQIATPVAGGRAVESALLSVLLLDDGRVLAGAVPTERLLQLAATPQ